MTQYTQKAAKSQLDKTENKTSSNRTLAGDYRQYRRHRSRYTRWTRTPLPPSVTVRIGSWRLPILPKPAG